LRNFSSTKTIQSGICSYSFSTNEFETFNTTDYNFSVRSIEEGLDNDIWVSTSEGILNYNNQKKSFQIFNKKDGLNNTAYRLGSSFKDVDNNIYFVYTNGFNYFSPSTFLTNKIAPPVYISDIEITSRNDTRNINVIYKDKIELNYDDYRLSIDYAALNYNRADKNKFKHRLIGFENQWNDIQFGTPIIYTSLEPKEYRLEVKASNNDGVWNDEGSIITIIKHPPYWETWWFRLLTTLFILTSIFLFFSWYTANIRKRNEQLRSEVAYRKAIEHKLQVYNNELKRSNNDLEQFAYVAAHDLKEPVHVITNFSGLLSKKYGSKFDKDAAKFIDIIVEGTKRMGKQVDSLLTYSIVGNKGSVYSKINLNQLIGKKLLDLSLLIKEKNADVIVKNLPEITGHEEQIGMVFTNLINNGLKFNTQKKPTIIIQAEEVDEYWKFSVKDNGIGIDPKYQEQIFGIFKRLYYKKGAYTG